MIAKRLLMLLMLATPIACSAPPDESVYVEAGEEKLVHGSIAVSATGKRIVHHGLGRVPGMNEEQSRDPTGPGIIRVTDDALETIFYWKHPKLVPSRTALSPDGALLAVVSHQLGHTMRQISPHATVRSPAGPGAFFVLDLDKKKKTFEFSLGDGLGACAFSENGKMLFVAWYDESWHYLRLYDVPSMREVCRHALPRKNRNGDLNEAPRRIEHVKFVDADTRIVAVSSQGLIEVLDASSLKVIGSVESAPAEEPFQFRGDRGKMQWAPSKNVLLVRGKSAAVHQFDPKKVAIVSTFEPYSGIGAFDPIPQTSLLFCNGYDNAKEGECADTSFKIWDLVKNKVVHEEKCADPKKNVGLNFAVMPDGKRLVFVKDAQLHIQDIGDCLPKTRAFLSR